MMQKKGGQALGQVVKAEEEAATALADAQQKAVEAKSAAEQAAGLLRGLGFVVPPVQHNIEVEKFVET